LAGIYIHIPFCRQACTYCNFHFSTSLSLKKELLKALETEISITTPVSNDEIIDTVYFGGGTPSLLSSEELAGILQSVRNKFRLAPHAEITIEANPDDINKTILAEWQNLGVKRLSLGIQSFDSQCCTKPAKY
jgi:oxygen-independent coproporphyrinogen-3 oxidase